ncbi:MAG TPA: hypothetical protein VMV94_09915 [Phycisphaerae bacterium]|nr:hypothetical protein [Phycisphaerae bacterium]
MFRRIREIPQDECPANPIPCLFGNAQISVASATELRFGNDGFRFNAVGGAIEMTLDGGATWQRLCSEVGSLAFSFHDRTGNQLSGSPLSATSRAAVRRVTVDIQLTRSGQTAHLRSAVYLRSFMNEVVGDP